MNKTDKITGIDAGEYSNLLVRQEVKKGKESSHCTSMFNKPIA